MRRRLDTELLRRGLVMSRTEAQEAIREGLVTVEGRPAFKAASLVAPEEAVALSGPPRTFVSRGGDKLATAIDRFGVEVEGKDCLDAGASTGGFTDCLLHRGATRVIAADVGYGQLDWRLRKDPRVTVLERTDVRGLSPEDLPFIPELIVVDLSFISLRTVVPCLARLSERISTCVLLIKPQFEVGRNRVGKGGVVRDPEAWRSAIDGVVTVCRDNGFAPRGIMASPLTGPAGNVEFLLVAQVGVDEAVLDVGAAIAEGSAVRGRG